MWITRKVEFSASHLCAIPSLGEQENRRIYGISANPRGHGHNFILEVTLSGDPDPVNGMVFDLKRLKDILNEHVVERFDHRFLNYEAPPFDRMVPTAENIAIEIWNSLEPVLDGSLHRVLLREDEDTSVEYFGEKPEGKR